MLGLDYAWIEVAQIDLTTALVAGSGDWPTSSAFMNRHVFCV
jgi:hypothetical protein